MKLSQVLFSLVLISGVSACGPTQYKKDAKTDESKTGSPNTPIDSGKIGDTKVELVDDSVVEKAVTEADDLLLDGKIKDAITAYDAIRTKLEKEVSDLKAATASNANKNNAEAKKKIEDEKGKIEKSSVKLAFKAKFGVLKAIHAVVTVDGKENPSKEETEGREKAVNALKQYGGAQSTLMFGSGGKLTVPTSELKALAEALVNTKKGSDGKDKIEPIKITEAIKNAQDKVKNIAQIVEKLGKKSEEKKPILSELSSEEVSEIE